MSQQRSVSIDHERPISSEKDETRNSLSSSLSSEHEEVVTRTKVNEEFSRAKTAQEFLKRITKPSLYTVFRVRRRRRRSTDNTDNDSSSGYYLSIERILEHGRRLFESLSERQRVSFFNEDAREFAKYLERIVKIDLWMDEGIELGDVQNASSAQCAECYMVTIAIEEEDYDERGGIGMVVLRTHALLTPLPNVVPPPRLREENKVEEEIELYAILQGEPREHPHKKHTNWVIKRESLEIQRQLWNEREEENENKNCQKTTTTISFKRKKFVECVLCKHDEEEDDYLLYEGLTTNVFILKTDPTDAERVILQTAPNEDVLLGVARGCVLHACDDLALQISLSHPRWSERASWIALFTTNSITTCKPFKGVVNAITKELVRFPEKSSIDADEIMRSIDEKTSHLMSES